MQRLPPQSKGLPMRHPGVSTFTSMSSPCIVGAHALNMQTKKSKLRGDIICKVLLLTRLTVKIVSKPTLLSHIPAGILNSYNANNSSSLGIHIVEDYYATVKIKPGKSAKIMLYFCEPKKGKASEWPLYSNFVNGDPQ
ncbi:hypothetical protein BGX27_005981 [Mortierella sp. AM989]|nr:hypothetical protein BGX27_005981 [Mortierella sp. AM989]